MKKIKKIKLSKQHIKKFSLKNNKLKFMKLFNGNLTLKIFMVKIYLFLRKI